MRGPTLRGPRRLALLALVSSFACGQDTGTAPQPPRAEAQERRASSAPVAAPLVRVGLEVLDDQRGAPLTGRKVGLLSHGASVTSDGRYAIDVLRPLGIEVVRLFAPEHGVRGQYAAGEKFKSGADNRSGLPVVSLYGQKTKPTAEDLAGLDALVIDLQDAGVRFYTYASTMMLALDAAARAGVEVVVLDRPNPLGGERVEGPVSDGSSPVSLVNMAPGPLVHGLTIGELAQLVNSRQEKPARLTVVPMKGWKRAMHWVDTRLVWTPPSPNLRTADAAVVYPGTALLEATNVSEGRGTDTPFLVFGAPWLKPDPLLPETPAAGLTLEATTFTPVSSAAAPTPKYNSQPCAGLRVTVKEPGQVAPYKLGVGLLAALRKQPEFEWRDGGAALDRLVGTAKLRAALEKGEAVDVIVASDLPAIEAWRSERQKFLIY